VHVPGPCSDYAACSSHTNSNDTTADGTPTGAFLTVANPGDRSWTRFDSIIDGTSNTLFIGEKHIRIGQLTIGNGNDNDNCIFNGDQHRTSGRVAGPGLLLAASPTESGNNGQRFGSWHTGSCNFLMGDGSVRSLAVTIDGTNLGALATRAGGEVYNGP
jgi:prepilin-type processing-associated H-X9-DG protein